MQEFGSIKVNLMTLFSDRAGDKMMSVAAKGVICRYETWIFPGYSVLMRKACCCDKEAILKMQLTQQTGKA